MRGRLERSCLGLDISEGENLRDSDREGCTILTEIHEAVQDCDHRSDWVRVPRGKIGMRKAQQEDAQAARSSVR